MIAQLMNVDEPPLFKGTYNCNGRKSCQNCNALTQRDILKSADKNRSLKNLSGRHDCNSKNVVYLLQCEICRKKFVGRTKTCTSRISDLTHANIARDHLAGVN